MTKTPFITADKLEQITGEFPTPFHIYDEKGIRETARAVNAAFSWNPGFKEFFAVKATPNPAILKILKEEGCGVDCATDTELVMSKKIGFDSSAISFTSNDTRAEEFVYARDTACRLVSRFMCPRTHISFTFKPKVQFFQIFKQI